MFPVSGCVAAGDDVDPKKRPVEDIRVGGPCAYRSCDGMAHITRIVQTGVSRKQADFMGGPGYKGYEIWFRFVPEKGVDIEGWAADLLDREHLLTLQNGWYPGPRYIKKYRLTQGSTCPCKVEIIEKGACTPIVFSFPSIDTRDYFESRQ